VFVDFGSAAFFFVTLPASISSFNFFNRLNSPIHCSSVKLLTFAHLLFDPALGGHLKTGHWWTLQNRPTEENQNKSIYTLPEVVYANTFLKRSRWAYTNLTWAEDTATQGCDRSADSAAGMMGRCKPPFWQHSGAKR